MIKWCLNMYMDDCVAMNPEKYKQLVIDNRINIPPLYCITLATNVNNLLDIISCNELLFKHYRRANVTVVGMAAAYKDAVELVKKIVVDVYKDTGDFDVRSYFDRG